MTRPGEAEDAAIAIRPGQQYGYLLLDYLFETVGRKQMIFGSYLLSGAMLAASAWLFAPVVLHPATQIFIRVVVFFASAGASAGYLTVSEIFEPYRPYHWAYRRRRPHEHRRTGGDGVRDRSCGQAPGAGRSPTRRGRLLARSTPHWGFS
jgi:hypothetical protein